MYCVEFSAQQFPLAARVRFCCLLSSATLVRAVFHVKFVLFKACCQFGIHAAVRICRERRPGKYKCLAWVLPIASPSCLVACLLSCMMLCLSVLIDGFISWQGSESKLSSGIPVFTLERLSLLGHLGCLAHANLALMPCLHR